MSKKKIFLFLFVMLFVLICLACVSATNFSEVRVLSVDGVLLTNGTEFNPGVINITINCSGNGTGYYVAVWGNLTNATGTLSNYSLNYTVANATPTNISLLNLSASYHFTYLVRCHNESTEDIGFNSSWLTLEVNARPTILTVTTPSTVTAKGNARTWNITWYDMNSTLNDSSIRYNSTEHGCLNDSVQMYVCSTDSFSNSTHNCSGTTYCSTNDETDKASSCSYTVKFTDYGGEHNYYIFLQDDNNFTSVSYSGTFMIAGSLSSEELEEEEQAGLITKQQQQVTPQPQLKESIWAKKVAGVRIVPLVIVIVAIFIIILAVVHYTKKK